MKDLYKENYKILLKERIHGNTFHVHGLEDLIYLGCQCYPKQSIDSMQSLWRISMVFCQNRKPHPKIYMKSFPNRQNCLEKEQSYRTHIAWFQNLLESHSNQNCGTSINI